MEEGRAAAATAKPPKGPAAKGNPFPIWCSMQLRVDIDTLAKPSQLSSLIGLFFLPLPFHKDAKAFRRYKCREEKPLAENWASSNGRICK
jgi:hypothetical protein